jgi:hypothetical protein
VGVPDGPLLFVRDCGDASLEGSAAPTGAGAGRPRRVMGGSGVRTQPTDAASLRGDLDAWLLRTGVSGDQKNPRLGTSLVAASMISAAVVSVSAASSGLACSVG